VPVTESYSQGESDQYANAAGPADNGRTHTDADLHSDADTHTDGDTHTDVDLFSDADRDADFYLDLDVCVVRD
jgi:hypothetical protein